MLLTLATISAYGQLTVAVSSLRTFSHSFSSSQRLFVCNATSAVCCLFYDYYKFPTVFVGVGVMMVGFPFLFLLMAKISLSVFVAPFVVYCCCCP